ncbi:aconitate hydratase AcnA [Chrysiogenes arsenatis]|uniref:aconitate hydratase AcnA n=1 Tax=Chrysiogenes arsenatis TaxID=309797 RepID=UPI0004178E68|nr:aconitate hydratase AcnA [Chrysiogenes arsenatis]
MERANFRATLTVNQQEYTYYSLELLHQREGYYLDRLPFSIRILVENALRKLDGKAVTADTVREISNWQPRYEQPQEIAYYPARVLMQDFTGVPGVVDLASMRDAVAEMGLDPKKINPVVPVDLVIDHSVQIDYYGTADALEKNVALEYERNSERYMLLKWAQKAFHNMRIVPPNSGICHQVNLEYLSQGVMTQSVGGETVAFPDTLVGTDSHTTMINGLGVMAWGVGGIEAEAVMLGQPYYMSIPEVIGVHLTGRLREGVTATDLVLTLTQLLRKHKVVEKFVEFFGPGMKELPLTDRATIANMAPEYGATMGFFPVDEKTIEYLRNTNRTEAAALTEAYCKAQKLFYHSDEMPEYTAVLDFNLSSVEPSLAGPARPQDRVALGDMRTAFQAAFGESDVTGIPVEIGGKAETIRDGSVVIAAITSCTNTSNPFVMVGAGLIAKKAAALGMQVPGYVKTSLAPGSRVVQDYLERAGLLESFEKLRFHLAGFGCTTCIGNSGPLHPSIEEAIERHKLVVASVLSGNRNFEARIHGSIRANYLASPMLVVIFALAGRVDIDLYHDPIGSNAFGMPVFLKDLWPSSEEIYTTLKTALTPAAFAQEYGHILDGDTFWQQLPVPEGETFAWDPQSTYIRRPPFFENFSLQADTVTDLRNARALLVLGDSVTTDHISPAGTIPKAYPAGQYLQGQGVKPSDFNSYGSRRGSHEVMMRGTFGNVRIKNALCAPAEGGITRKLPEGDTCYIYDASVAYRQQNTPLIILAGKEYGTGSSRDWAAKGTALLGVKGVIAESFERIHRSNLIGMGVLPMVFQAGQSWRQLGLTGEEEFSIEGIASLTPGKLLNIMVKTTDGQVKSFKVIAKLNTDIEVEYFQSGGILAQVLRQLAAE